MSEVTGISDCGSIRKNAVTEHLDCGITRKNEGIGRVEYGSFRKNEGTDNTDCGSIRRNDGTEYGGKRMESVDCSEYGSGDTRRYNCHSDRESWMADRDAGIGASEAAVVLGISRWETPLELWQRKTGRKQAKDLSADAAVSYGQRAEGPLRALYAERTRGVFQIRHRPFDCVFQEFCPWLYATLDGELVTAEGEVGILEIKTCSPAGKAGWKEWEDHIPDHYYAQICHQFLATGFSFAVLFAELMHSDGVAELREYWFLREECLRDMEQLKAAEERFWECVRTDRMPNVVLRL